jgi:hypothetical protein
MSKRVPFPFQQKHPATPVFGTVTTRITIEVDERCIMRTAVFCSTKQLTNIEVIGILLDSMQGQYQQMMQQASLIIDPNKPRTQPPGEPNDGETEKGNDGNGGDPGGVPGIA